MNESRCYPGVLWRQLPNSISAARLLAALIMMGALLSDRETLFKWLLFWALVSDILDGWIARAYGLTSRLGALLDSTADMVTWIVAAAGFFYLFSVGIRRHTPSRVASGRPPSLPARSPGSLSLP